MNIKQYTVEEMIDPTGILTGKRYEFLLDVELDENDELYTESGTGIRVIFVVDGAEERVAMAHFFDKATEEAFEFELEPEEEAAVFEFCKKQIEA